jgi:myo-inositol-1(or 4)-monophosphatase
VSDLEDELLDVAREAAEAGAGELLRRFGRRPTGLHTKTSPTDPVSEADVAAEAAVRAVLERRRPGDAILAEEGGDLGGDGELRWVVDPLDGTVNFLFGIPAFVVSVACEDSSGGLAGVVLDPVRDECFAAVRSGPATLNGEVVSGSERSDLSTALVATGFGYDAGVRERQAAVVSRVLPRVRDIRRVGAAAMDLCWTAAGRFDAYYERGVKPWDIAAGTLIASRAGLVVRELPAGADDASGVVVAPAGLIEDLVGLVAPEQN